MLHIKPHIKC
uniref:Uncharacterized protein n=1 Tax=Rhizophora mucronata TaxID=61149 RepID=A0A2P2PND7_RHIMU